METRIYKKTGKPISLLGFGCMRLPRLNDEKPDIDISTAESMIDRAYAQGVNYFDTAYMYHEGMSETFLGHALKKYPRESFYLADKMPGCMGIVHSLEDGKRIFAEQLQRCGVDYFDFYLLHNVASIAHFEETYLKTGVLDYLLEEKAAGRIRNLGFSFHGNLETFEYLMQARKWDFAQIQLNYLDWDGQGAGKLYACAVAHDVPVIVMEPVKGGTLVSLCDEAVNILHAADPQHSVASWAIRFAASLPGVLTVLSGMSTPAQVEDNLATVGAFQPLSEAEREVLQNAVSAYLAKRAVPCTGCRYCMDCPAGVDIPRVFSVYNTCAVKSLLPNATQDEAERLEKTAAFQKAYAEIPESAQAHNCVSCLACEQHCPQGIQIHQLMAEISKLEPAR